MRFAIQPFVKYLRNYDVKSAQKPDVLIANSIFQKEWIKEHYNRDSTIIYPPVDLSLFRFYPKKEDFYVAVGRFAKMKRFDLLIKAFNKMPDRKLILIGDGELMNEFRAMAKPNIQFTGFLNSKDVYDYVKRAKASVYVGIEDFGIAAVESQSAGTPVIAYSVGGTGETIDHLKTGYLYNDQNENSIIKAVTEFERIQYDYKKIEQHSKKFSTEKFHEELLKLVNEL